MEAAVLVLDFGTSKVKANLITPEGKIIRSRSEEYRWENQGGFIEIDPAVIWDSGEKAVRDLLAEGPADLLALSFAFFGDNLIAVGRDGRPLTQNLACGDTRSTPQVQQMLEAIGDEKYYRINGMRITYMSVVSKILWLKQNRPEVFRDAARFISIQQYFMARLGFDYVSDLSMASRQSAFDIRAKDWSPLLLDFLGISAERLGPVVHGDQIIGTTSSFGAVKFPKPLPVITGAHDCVCGYLGLGVISLDRGYIGAMMGTYHHLGCIDHSLIEDLSMVGYPASVGDKYVNYHLSNGRGAMLDWFVRLILQYQDDSSYPALFGALGRRGFAPPFFLPYETLTHGSFYLMDLAHDREDLFQAVIEGLTYEMRIALESLESLSKHEFGTLRVGGGAARSPEWMQILANVTGRRIEIMPTAESTSVGAAILALKGLGVFGSYDEAVVSMCRAQRTFGPDEKEVKRYQTRFADYAGIRKKIY